MKSLVSSLVAALGIVALVMPCVAGQKTAHVVDYHAVFKTHVPSLAKGGQHGPPSGNGGGVGSTSTPPPSASFTLSPYSVPTNPTQATDTEPEAEEDIAVDPSSPNNLLAAISDFSLCGGFNFTKYAYSTDGGSTWTSAFVPMSSCALPTGDGNSWDANSDPVVADDGTNIYLSDLYFDVNFVGRVTANGLYVSVAQRNSGAVSFTSGGTYAVVPPNSSGSNSEDKPWIAVDKTSGNVYVSWTHFTNNSDWIWLSESIDHGQTWSTPIQINPGTQNGGVQGSQVAVGPDGKVYVVYEVFYSSNQRQQFLATCTSGSPVPTCSTPKAITPIFNELSFSAPYRTDSFASIAVSPALNSSGSDNVYVVYSDQPSGYGAQVEYIYSTDGGSSFSSPVVIDDDASTDPAANHFMPAVAVDGNGTIHVSWFDTRDSSSNKAEYYDIYASYSDGSTLSSGIPVFSTNAALSSVYNAGSSNGFIGDYAGIAADVNSSGESEAHPVWTSGGFNGGYLETSTLTLPTP